MRCKRAFAVAASLSLAALAGCVSFQVDEHSYQFNEATGSLSLRLLLLNAVRASKDYPLQFTKINGYQGQGTSGASVSATLPISAPGSGSISPKVDVKDGISEINLVDLNTEEAQQALKKTLPLKTYRYYEAYGGSRSYITPTMLMVEYVSMPKALYSLIGKYVNERCPFYLSGGGPRSKEPRFEHNKFACAALDELRSQCSDLEQELLAHPDRKRAVLQNHVTSKCQHIAFVAGTLYLAIIGGTVGPVQGPEKGGKGGRGDPSPTSTKKAPGNTFNIYAVDPKGNEDKTEPDKEPINLPIYDADFAAICERAKLCIRKPQVGTLASDVLIQLRSPERMVRFLGELISAQSYGPQRFTPIGVDPIRRKTYDLLVVKHGAPPPGSAAVSVVSPDGELLYVPRRNPDLPKEDFSLETLSLVSEVLNAAVSKKAFPAVTSLTVKAD